MDLQTEINICNQMRQLRESGDMDKALDQCQILINAFPENPFYRRIEGDLLQLKGEYGAAKTAYLALLERIGPQEKQFHNFANRFQRLILHISPTDRSLFAEQILSLAKEKHKNSPIYDLCQNLIAPYLPIETPISDMGKHWKTQLQKQGKSQELFDITRNIEKNNPTELSFLLNQELSNSDLLWTNAHRGSFFSACFERLKQYDQAIILLKKIIAHKRDGITIRSLFRIGRIQDDYSAAEQILATYPKILKFNDFNIGYELVYYFEKNNQMDQVLSTLKHLEKLGIESLPIQKTLKNFYLRFGLLDDAKHIQNTIDLLQTKKDHQPNRSTRYSKEVQESAEALGPKIEELYSQLDHKTRLAALSDLTQGISHELGQPLTNIRFTIQMQQKKLAQSGILDQVNDAFKSILEETERMGGLIQRLAPITSNKKVVENCNLVARIQQTIHLNKERLKNVAIKSSVKPKTPLVMRTDPVMWDQIINNLLLNAIDAIREKPDKTHNRVDFTLSRQKNTTTLTCTDTGIGIPVKNRKTLFDPFFTTKPPGKGEGLGLFIIWNLLKMQGGTVSLDPHYTKGARFIITLPEISETHEEL